MVNRPIAAAGNIINVTDKTFQYKVLYSKVPVVICFTNDSSMHRAQEYTQKAKEDLQAFAGATQNYSDDELKFAIVSTSDWDGVSTELLKTFNTSGRIPTKIFFIPNGNGTATVYSETGRMDGFYSKQDVIDFIESNFEVINNPDKSNYTATIVHAPKLTPPSKADKIAGQIATIVFLVIAALFFIGLCQVLTGCP